MEREIMTILLSALGLIITGLATWLTQKLIRLLNEKIDNTQLNSTITLVNEVIDTVVKAVCQTYVNEQKINGNWSTETQQKALNKAIALAKSMLNDDTQSYIHAQYGNVDEWLITQIESCVFSLKE